MTTAAASFVEDAAVEIGQGNRPERSAVASTNVVRNAVIGVVGVATITFVPAGIGALVGGLTGFAAGAAVSAAAYWPLNEGLKKSKVGGVLSDFVAKSIDTLSGKELPNVNRRVPSPAFNFVHEVGSNLRVLARTSKHMAWLAEALDWMGVPPEERPKGELDSEG